MPRRAGKRDEIDKAKIKSQSQKEEAKKPSQGQQRKKSQKASQEPRRSDQKARKEGLKNNNPTARHTTNPSGSCLGRSFLIPNIRKARA
jgi:hypothetical protein